MINGVQIGKNLGIKHNVSFNVIDQSSGKIVQHHQGHNMATNSMLVGIGHYLAGEGVLNQGYEMLRYWVPQYISLGTMGLGSQDEDPDTGLPLYLGSNDLNYSDQERCELYMDQYPGYTADGYDDGKFNNNRPIYRAFNDGTMMNCYGLGPLYKDRANTDDVIDCELISSTCRRSKISYREVIPETHAEHPHTIDVIFTAIISTGQLQEFRRGDSKYIFITEAGLWSVQNYIYGGTNGLLAGYRIVPPNIDNWDMSNSNNRRILREEILRVGFNQVVQVVWKIQIGSLLDIERENYLGY